jgi:pimeloyl-ACP methyl ester carboxylesterase
MTAPTLVLLHGVGLDHHVWEPVISRLPTEVRVVALDLPGHGAAPPAPAGITLHGLADAVVQQIPAGSHLVGFSLGALVAQHLAIHNPALVASLTSVSSVCQRTADERAAVLRRLDAAGADFTGSVAASLHRWYDDTQVAPDLVAQTRATLLANDPQSFVNCYRVFATADAEIADQLGTIAVPALAVTGECDPGSTPEMTRRLAAAIPGCEAVIIPGARHMLPVERPNELARCLTSFIGRYAHA